MFKRIAYEDWVLLVGVVSFVLVGFVFIVGTLRALRIPKAKRQHLASLPLDETPPTTTEAPSTPKKP